jgi:hypothetical protein
MLKEPIKTRTELENLLYRLADSFLNEGETLIKKWHIIALEQQNDGVKVFWGDPRRLGAVVTDNNYYSFNRERQTFHIMDLISDNEGNAHCPDRMKIAAIAEKYNFN